MLVINYSDSNPYTTSDCIILSYNSSMASNYIRVAFRDSGNNDITLQVGDALSVNITVYLPDIVHEIDSKFIPIDNNTIKVNNNGKLYADQPIPTATSDLTNDSGFITSSALSGYATETWVGQQGYLTSVTWNDVTNKPTFAAVATSGDYDDLTNKPTIPAAQVNADWNASSGISQILNKPTLATVATSGSYNDLSDKPTIPDVSNMMTTNTTQYISGVKTFYDHTLVLKPSGSATSSSYRPTLEFRPFTGFAVGSLQYHLTNHQLVFSTDETGGDADIQLALRAFNSTGAYSALLPRTSDKATSIGSGNVTLPLGIKVGASGTVNKADNGGAVTLPVETWTFLVDDGQGGTTTITKDVVVG